MASFAKARGPTPQIGAAVHDVVVSGVDTITDIGGGLIRVVFYVNRRSAVDGTLEKVPLDETLVMPIASVPDGIGKAMLAIGRKILAREDGLTVAVH